MYFCLRGKEAGYFKRKLIGKNQPRTDDIFKLVKYSFYRAGLHAMDIMHCRKLSEAILQKNGRTISPVTLFRMANPEKYSIRHYPYTLQLLLDYCALRSFNDIPQIIVSNDTPVIINGRLNDTSNPLSLLLSIVLEKGDQKLMFDFLDGLPEEFNKLGKQQAIISHAFANFFRSESNPSRAVEKFKYFHKHPNFQIYFTMSFPDFDFMNHYFYAGMEEVLMLQKVEHSLKVHLETPDYIGSHALEKDIYNLAMYLWMSFVKKNYVGVKKAGAILFEDRNTELKILRALQNTPTLAYRFLTARYIYSYVQGNKAMMHATLQQALDRIDLNKGDGLRSHASVFGVTMLCDMLVLMGKPLDELSYFLTYPKFRANALYNYEPAMTRFLIYGEPYLDKTRLVGDSSDPNYFMGFYELNHSHYLLEKYKKVNTKLRT